MSISIYEAARSIVADAVAKGELVRPPIDDKAIRRIKKKEHKARVIRTIVHDKELLMREFSDYLAETPLHLLRVNLVVKHLRIHAEIASALFHEKGIKISQGVQIKADHKAELAALNAKWEVRNKEREQLVISEFNTLDGKSEASSFIAKKLGMRKWLVTTILRRHDMFYFIK